MNYLNSFARTAFTASSDFILDDLKIYCRVTTGDVENNLLTIIMNSYIDMAEQQSGLSMGSSTYEAVYDYLGYCYIDLPRAPLVSVASVIGIDEDGAENVLPIDDYIVESGNSSKIVLKDGKTWPDSDRGSARYKITYTCELTTIPPSIVLGVYMAVFNQYVERKDSPPVHAIAMWKGERIKLI